MRISFLSYHLSRTPLYCVKQYCTTKNLFLKLEQYHPSGSIKERTAYYIMKDLLENGALETHPSLVESSSGNLGLALGKFSHDLGIPFLCLVDPTIPATKVAELKASHIQIHMVTLGDYATYRDARINLAASLDKDPEWIWTRQYSNPANAQAHYETTGPEILEQMGHQVDYVVASVGTGGTICGIGRFFKQYSPQTQVVAVEPLGSTIFGGQPSCYLSVGSGMNGPSEIISHYGDVIDFFVQVPDQDALLACAQLRQIEHLSVGVTTGAAVVAAQYLARMYPRRSVVVISPDGGERYAEIMHSANLSTTFSPVELHAHVPKRENRE